MRVQRGRAARHRAGVPVLQQPARVQHQRVLRVRAAHSPASNSHGTNLPRPSGVGKPSSNSTDDAVGPSPGRGTGQSLPRSAEVVVRQARVARRQRRRTRRRPPRASRSPSGSPTRSTMSQMHLPVSRASPGRLQRRPAELHAAVGVGVRPGLLQERRGRQDHVGELGRLGQEDVLHGQEVEARQRLADLVDVRVGEERVLAQHEHAPDAARPAPPAMISTTVSPGCRVERHAPGRLELLRAPRRTSTGW